MMSEHYITLGLQEGASQQEIQAAYERLSKELDPANNNNQEFFKEEYKKLQQAYKALSASSILATKGGAYPTPKPNNTTSTTTNKPAGKDRALNPATHKFKAALRKYKIVIASAFLFLFSIIAYNVFFVPKSPVYLADNGVTIKAHKWAKIGDEGIVDGVLYTIEDKGSLLEKIEKGYFLNRVCTSLITDMSELLKGNTAFNQDISSWDVSGVNDMNDMFSGAQSFNKDISKWDVSNVTQMKFMFSGAKFFNQALGAWDVSAVNDMRYMFSGAQSFNKDISKWDVSNVTQMKFMFSRAKSFNQDIGSWDVSGVNDMDRMFLGARSFNQDLGSWDVSAVRNFGSDIEYMFLDTPNWTLPKPKF